MRKKREAINQRKSALHQPTRPKHDRHRRGDKPREGALPHYRPTAPSMHPPAKHEKKRLLLTNAHPLLVATPSDAHFSLDSGNEGGTSRPWKAMISGFRGTPRNLSTAQQCTFLHHHVAVVVDTPPPPFSECKSRDEKGYPNTFRPRMYCRSNVPTASCSLGTLLSVCHRGVAAAERTQGLGGPVFERKDW